jgi:hypothetical protein
MKILSVAIRTALPLLIPLSLFAGASPSPGDTAPNFTLKDSNGKTRSLADFKGKYVVLEWVNFGCPFVQKHYHSGNMPRLQKTYTAQDIVWVSVCSSAPGKQGYFEGEELRSQIARMKGAASAYLLDPEGKVGKLYAAKTTPTMYVINPEGKIVYGGGIDNIPSADPDDIPKARNYVREALDLSLAGKNVEVSTSRSYGCSVKYAD